MTGATAAVGPSWTCSGCQVTVSWVPGTGAHDGLPQNWVDGAEGRFCLQCRRANAQESALVEEGEDLGREERMKLRRDALIEFELRRTPERPDSAIARACRSSVPAIGKVRSRLDKSAPGWRRA
jgi:hypothetical protein